MILIFHQNFSTLFVNACAVLNFRVSGPKETGFIDPDARSTGLFDFHKLFEFIFPNLGDRIREFLLALQYFRVFIALWNVFVMFLMFV